MVYLDTVQEMLKSFVENFSILFNAKNLTYNVHNVLHIVQCVRDLGPLQSFAAYKFENYLQSLKRQVKKPSKILEQIHKQYIVCETKFQNLHKDQFIRSANGKIKKVYLGGYCYTSKIPNNICSLKNNKIFVINRFDRMIKIYT